mmetsp:Transcript_64002/g.187251  ORF Transcript_64002/g.187251 Transcript_64002/m.187251 type:complete len:207 (+) Transcript_64002:410-1030(+)
MDHLLRSAHVHDRCGSMEDVLLHLGPHAAANPQEQGERRGSEDLPLCSLVSRLQCLDRLQLVGPDDQCPLHVKDMGNPALLRLPVHQAEVAGHDRGLLRHEAALHRQDGPGLRRVHRLRLRPPADHPAGHRGGLQPARLVEREEERGRGVRPRFARELQCRQAQKGPHCRVQDPVRQSVRRERPHLARLCGRGPCRGQPHGGCCCP